VKIRDAFSLLDNEEMLQCAREYDSKAVANFVTSIGYSDYAERFDNNGISGEVLIECTDEDLKELEIGSALARLRILIYFKREIQGLSALAENVPTEEVVKFLDGLKLQEKEQYKKSYGDNNIDGEMLLTMDGNDELMIELGVQKSLHRRTIRSKFKTFLVELGHSHT